MIDYVPKPCRGDEAAFSGQVKIRPLEVLDKYELMDSLGIELSESGDIDVKSMSNWKTMIGLIKMSESHYESVNVVKKEDGREYKSFADLNQDLACEGILVDVAVALLRAKPGK